MNTKNTTPPQYEEKFPYKVPFPVHGHFAMIHALSAMGVVIKVDAQQVHACACFDNTHDFNEFKEKLKHHPAAVTA